MTFTLFATQLMQLLVMSSLKTSLVLVAALVLIRLLHRSSASLRHWLLNLTLIATLLLPVLSLVSPVWSLAILPGTAERSGGVIDRTTLFSAALDMKAMVAKSDTNGAFSEKANPIGKTLPAGIIGKPTAPASASLDFSGLPRLTGTEMLLLVWLGGVSVVLLRWLIQLRRIWKVTRRAIADPSWNVLLAEQTKMLKIRRQVRLVFSAEIRIPMTWGLLRPIIVLPVEADAWDDIRRGVVLRHELAHIVRWDYLTQWILLLSCTLNWFNPLIWKIAQRITLEREQASDDLVLSTGIRGIDYAAHLLDIARSALTQRPFQMVGLAMAQRSDLEQRIRGVLNKSQQRSTSRRIRLLIFAAVVTVLLPLGGMHLSSAYAQAASTTLSLAVDQGLAEGIQDQGLLTPFLTAHPGVIINLIDSQDIPDAANNLDTYFAALDKYTRSADVLFFNGFNLGLSPLATRSGYLLDLAPLVQSDPEALQDDFYPQLWTSYQWDGGVWGLPLSAEVALMVYNKTAFDHAGLTYPDGSWTLAQWMNAAPKLISQDANGNVVSGGFANNGRIFREAFWRSLFESDAVDASVLPNAPQFNRPDIEAALDAYHQFELQNVITSDPSTAAMYVDAARKMPPENYDWTLLPGNHSVLLPNGFAVSAGTQQPELAYDLAKYMTSLAAIAEPIPARKSTTIKGIANFVQEPYQALIQQAFDNGLNVSNLRFGDYLNNARWPTDVAADAMLDAQNQVSADLQTADANHSTLSISVVEPIQPTLAPGKIALNFDLVGQRLNDANQTGWSQMIDGFTASDPQVGLVNLRTVGESASMAAQKSDCFYYPTNAVPTISDSSLLDLTPLLNADPNFDPNDFVSGVLRAVQRGDQTLALPITLLPLILNYDSARFEAANLPMPTNTWIVADFANALNALKPDSQGHSPFVDPDSGGAALLVLIASYGGLPLDFRTNPPTINFTDPATVDAIRQVLDLARSGDIRYAALGSLDQSQMNLGPDNTTAIYTSAFAGFGRKLPPDAAPDLPVLFPRGQQYNGVAYDLGAGYISNQSQNPEACYRFLDTLTQYPELFSAMPARRSVLSDPTFIASTAPDVLALYNDLDILLQDPQTIPFQDFNYGAATSASFLYEHWLFEAFDSYVLNNGDLDAALQDAQTYATAFQTCSANLPPLNLDEANKSSNPSAAVPFVDCAEQADNRLTPFLDPLVGR